MRARIKRSARAVILQHRHHSVGQAFRSSSMGLLDIMTLKTEVDEV